MLPVLTIPKEYKTRVSYKVPFLHGIFTERVTCCSLPSILFGQLITCTKKYNNSILLACLKPLIARALFTKTEVWAFPIGYSREHIDQLCSETSSHLCSNNAITLFNLHSELCHSYARNVKDFGKKSTENKSSLCKKKSTFFSVPAFSV